MFEANGAGASATYNHLGNLLKDTGALDEAVKRNRQAPACNADNLVAHIKLPYAHALQIEDGYAILDERRRLPERHEARFVAVPGFFIRPCASRAGGCASAMRRRIFATTASRR